MNELINEVDSLDENQSQIKDKEVSDSKDLNENHETHSYLGKIHIPGLNYDFHIQSSFVGVGLILLIIGVIIFFVNKLKNNSFSILFESIVEKMYEFFEDITGKEEKPWIKSYIVTLFFVILFSNVLGLLLDFTFPIFGIDSHGNFNMHHYISIPTGDINYNLGLALIGVIIVTILQFRHLGPLHFIYDYFPIFGKNIIDIPKGSISNPFVYWPVKIFVKMFDIIISVFLGLLEIIGLFAKIISLSFRLYGNMFAGALLALLLFSALIAGTKSLLGFQFPVLIPIILFVQGLLVAFVQAIVLPLLVAIFIKVATSSQEH